MEKKPGQAYKLCFLFETCSYYHPEVLEKPPGTLIKTYFSPLLETPTPSESWGVGGSPLL